MGKQAMQLLHRQINEELNIPVKSIVYGELIVRESSGGLSISAPSAMARGATVVRSQ